MAERMFRAVRAFLCLRSLHSSPTCTCTCTPPPSPVQVRAFLYRTRQLRQLCLAGSAAFRARDALPELLDAVREANTGGLRLELLDVSHHHAGDAMLGSQPPHPPPTPTRPPPPAPPPPCFLEVQQLVLSL